MNNIKVVKFLYVNMGIDKWFIQNLKCDYINDMLRGVLKIDDVNFCNDKKNREFWEYVKNIKDFNNMSCLIPCANYSCNPLLFYPYIDRYSKNLKKYMDNEKIDVLIAGEMCEFDIFNNYLKSFDYSVCQEYFIDYSNVDKKILKVFDAIDNILGINLNKDDEKRVLNYGVYKAFMVLSNIYKFDNIPNQDIKYDPHMKTRLKNIYNNLPKNKIYTKNEIIDGLLSEQDRNYNKFINNLQIVSTKIKDKSFIVVNIHNRTYAGNEVHIYYAYIDYLVSKLIDYPNVVIVGDLNLNTKSDDSYNNYIIFLDGLKKDGYNSYNLNFLYSIYESCNNKVKESSLILFAKLKDFKIISLLQSDCEPGCDAVIKDICDLNVDTSSHSSVQFNMISMEDLQKTESVLKNLLNNCYKTIYEKIINSKFFVKYNRDLYRKNYSDIMKKYFDNGSFNFDDIVDMIMYMNACLILAIGKYTVKDYANILTKKIKKYMIKAYYLDNTGLDKFSKLINCCVLLMERNPGNDCGIVKIEKNY